MSWAAQMCEHANEVPGRCPCATGCYCKSHTCVEPYDKQWDVLADRPCPTFTEGAVEEAVASVLGHRPCQAPDCFEPACLRSDVDFAQIRAAIKPLVEQLAATAYAMGRRDEREAAEEEMRKFIDGGGP